MKQLPESTGAPNVDKPETGPQDGGIEGLGGRSEEALVEARWEALGHRLAPLMESIGGEVEMRVIREPVDPDRVRK
ncbi:hypothetical protein [Palleronia sp.]|uniref:hypothetical protein n=1 Tax=Palleronia sp. TaxID=1940284 RepID=UPI0035C7C623